MKKVVQFLAGLAITALLLSPISATADDADDIAEDIAEECGDFAEGFEELSDVGSASEFLDEAAEFIEEFDEFVEDVLEDADVEEGEDDEDKDDDEGLVIPFANTWDTVLEELLIVSFFVDEHGIARIRGNFVFAVDGDFAGSTVTISAGATSDGTPTGSGGVDFDLATGLGVAFSDFTYDVDLDGMSGTFEGCAIQPQFPDVPPPRGGPQVGVGSGDFDGIILISDVISVTFLELAEEGLLIAPNDD